VSKKTLAASQDCDLYDVVGKMRSHMEQGVQQAQSGVRPQSDKNDDLLNRTCNLLHSSPMAALMLRELSESGWRIDLQDMGESDFTLDFEQKILELNHYGLSDTALSSSEYFANAVLASMIRGMRDITQEHQIKHLNAQYHPQDLLMIERIRCADMDVMTVLVAWELRVAGHNSLWRYLLGAENSDIVQAFSRILEPQGDRLLHKALRAAFKQWFASENRVGDCEREALDYIDSLMEEENSKLRPGQDRLNAKQVEFLSTLPNQNAYLRDLGDEILNTGLYAGLEDELNRTHLFHIIRDMETTYRGGVAFRDADLAAKIFPENPETVH